MGLTEGMGAGMGGQGWGTDWKADLKKCEKGLIYGKKSRGKATVSQEKCHVNWIL